MSWLQKFTNVPLVIEIIGYLVLNKIMLKHSSASLIFILGNKNDSILFCQNQKLILIDEMDKPAFAIKFVYVISARSLSLMVVPVILLHFCFLLFYLYNFFRIDESPKIHNVFWSVRLSPYNLPNRKRYELAV